MTRKFLLAVALLAAGLPVGAQPAAEPPPDSPAPRATTRASRPPAAAPVSLTYEQMSITAKSFELDGKRATITFSGNVVVDFRTTHIECQKAVVYSTRAGDKIIKIVMTGSVLVQQKMGSFRGANVTYFPATEKLQVEGNTQTKIRVEKGVPLFE